MAKRTRAPGYVLSAHAATVIAERGIDPTWVARVLAQRQRVEVDKTDPALRHAIGGVPEYGGRVLRVVYNETATPWRVVTAYFDRAETKRKKR